MPATTGKKYCGTCQGYYEYEVPEGATPEEALASLFQAQEDSAAAHGQWHADNPGVIHVRRQVNPRRVKGDGFYKVTLGAGEDGSQTLCGAPAGMDMTWAETRHASRLAQVTCADCRRIRTEKAPALTGGTK